MERIFLTLQRRITRLVAPAISAVITWLASHGVHLPAEWADNAETAILLLVMAVLTAVIDPLVDRARKLFGEL